MPDTTSLRPGALGEEETQLRTARNSNWSVSFCFSWEREPSQSKLARNGPREGWAANPGPYTVRCRRKHETKSVQVATGSDQRGGNRPYIQSRMEGAPKMRISVAVIRENPNSTQTCGIKDEKTFNRRNGWSENQDYAPEIRKG